MIRKASIIYKLVLFFIRINRLRSYKDVKVRSLGHVDIFCLLRKIFRGFVPFLFLFLLC